MERQSCYVPGTVGSRLLALLAWESTLATSSAEISPLRALDWVAVSLRLLVTSLPRAAGIAVHQLLPAEPARAPRPLQPAPP